MAKTWGLLRVHHQARHCGRMLLRAGKTWHFRQKGWLENRDGSGVVLELEDDNLDVNYLCQGDEEMYSQEKLDQRYALVSGPGIS